MISPVNECITDDSQYFKESVMIWIHDHSWIMLLHVYGNSEPFQNQEKAHSLKLKQGAIVCGIQVGFLSKIAH